MSPQLAEARHERILAALRRDGAVAVADLATDLGVVPMTIRRDINQLAALGLLRRVHGGAVALGRRRGWSGLQGFSVEMIVPLVDHYWTVISYRAQAEAAAAGARFELRDSGTGGFATHRLAKDAVEQRRVDGLILAPPIVEPGRRAVIDWLAFQTTSVVMVERAVPIDLPQAQSVTTDHRLGGALAAQHLSRLGHRRVALVRPPTAAGAAEVEQGWRAAVDLLGHAECLVLDSVSPTAPERDRHVERTLDALVGQGVTGVLVSGDPYALALLQACQARRIEVPSTLSIVAYGDDVAGLGDPALTVVRPPREQVGRTAVQLIAEHLHAGAEHQPRQVMIAPRLVERATTAPVVSL